MTDDPTAVTPTDRRRFSRPRRAADDTGVMRWLPGLQTLRHYDPAWLRDDIVAGLVLTTMLVPVGIAYAVASGVPGINGLYTTIIPLLAYALFGPSRILVLRSGFVTGCGDPRRGFAAFGRRSDASGGSRRHDGDRLGHRLHSSRIGAARLHNRAALQANPLRLHERHCLDGLGQPTAQAVRLFDR